MFEFLRQKGKDPTWVTQGKDILTIKGASLILCKSKTHLRK